MPAPSRIVAGNAGGFPARSYLQVFGDGAAFGRGARAVVGDHARRAPVPGPKTPDGLTRAYYEGV